MPLFQNRITYTKDVMKSFYLSTVAYRLIAFLLLGLLAIAGVFLLITEIGSDSPTFLGLDILPIVLLICLVALLIYFVKRIAGAWKKAYDDSVKGNGGKESEIVVDFGDEICVTNEVTGGVATYAYSEISSLKCRSGLILLYSFDKRVIILARDGFSLGDRKSFLGFINGKLTGKSPRIG